MFFFLLIIKKTYYYHTRNNVLHYYPLLFTYSLDSLLELVFYETLKRRKSLSPRSSLHLLLGLLYSCRIVSLSLSYEVTFRKSSEFVFWVHKELGLPLVMSCSEWVWELQSVYRSWYRSREYNLLLNCLRYRNPVLDPVWGKPVRPLSRNLF